MLSEPTPVERGDKPRAPEFGTADELVKLVGERKRSALQQRRPAERDWVLNIAAYFGGRGQWLRWDDDRHFAESMMLASEPRVRYVTHNLIKPLIKKRIALSTMTKPDAQIAAGSPAPIDRDAAGEARCISAHLARLWKLPNQMLELAWWADVCGVVYRKSYWNPSMMADIAFLDPATGQIGKRSAKVGELCSHVTPPFEVLVDSGSYRYDRAKWIIHYRDFTPSELKEMYGKAADGIEPDSVGASGYIDPYLAETRNLYHNSDSHKNAIRVYECWEFATPGRFDSGRLIVTTEHHLLHAGKNPLEGTAAKGNPFARLVFEEAPNHPYGSSDVTDMRDIQVDINRLLTKATTKIEDAKDTLIRSKIDGAGADAYVDDDEFAGIHEKRNFRIVNINPGGGGMQPVWQAQPGVGGDLYHQLELNWQHLQHIAGIHDVQQGGAPVGVTAGIAIELLQQSDRTQLGLFTGKIEQFAVDFTLLDIAIYGKYASANLPRLMGVDDSGNPEQAQSRAVAFRALTSGGTVRVIVSPGSATPKSPAGQQQEVLAFMQAGLFDPNNPSADIAVALLPHAMAGRIAELRQQAKQQNSAAAEGGQQGQMQQLLAAQKQGANQQQAANQSPPQPSSPMPPQPPMLPQDDPAIRQKLLEAAIRARIARGSSE